MKKSFGFLTQISWLVFLVGLACGCEKGNVDREAQAQMQAQAEASAKSSGEIIGATHDLLDITGGAIEGQGMINGKYTGRTGSIQHLLDCDPYINTTFHMESRHDTIIYRGYLVIDYGDGSGCADSSEVRKGKIIDSLTFMVKFKDSIVYDLKQSITFQGFYQDSIQLDGTFVMRALSGGTVAIDIRGAQLSYPDGTSASWDGSLLSVYDHGTEWGKRDDSREVTGSISGTNREGANFEASIRNPLLFDYSCTRHIPVSGTIDVTVGGALSVVDYGNGECNKIYTIASAGTTTEYTFRSHHAD